MKLRVIYFWFFMLVMMQAYCQSLPRRTVAGKREPRFRNLTRAGLSPVLAAPNGGVGSGIAPDPIRSDLIFKKEEPVPCVMFLRTTTMTGL